MSPFFVIRRQFALALGTNLRQTRFMMRLRFALCLCLPLLLTACAIDAEDLKREAQELRGFGLRAEFSADKPAIDAPSEPVPPPQLTVTPTCAAMIEEISRTAPLCVLEQADADRQKITCTPQTCPECAKMIAAREGATKAGCI